jgi:hypothetical protein
LVHFLAIDFLAIVYPFSVEPPRMFACAFRQNRGCTSDYLILKRASASRP